LTNDERAVRRLWPEEPVWIGESNLDDWQQDEIWVELDGERVAVRPVEEVRVERFSATSESIETRDGLLDLSLVLVPGGLAAGVFTTSGTASPAASRGPTVVADGRVDVLAVISKNANVATPSAVEDTDRIVEEVARAFDLPGTNVLLSCTGVIGRRLPVDEVVPAIPEIAATVSPSGLPRVAHGIMTTDPRPKMVSVQVGDVTVVGMVKGAGMIEPRMATMLAYLFTDADLESEKLERIFRRAISKTLNSLTTDSDTSTSDTALFLSSAAKRLPDDQISLFEAAVLGVCAALARGVVSDAEGASKVIEVEVSGAATTAECRDVARKIANSPLVKAAVNGCDPNWGRVVMALGKPDGSGRSEHVDMSALRISLMGVTAYHGDRSLDFDSDYVSDLMRNSRTVSIAVELGPSSHRSKVFGCDLTEDYVRFNSIYTT
jgi:glutamate N-acetyltransferase / amino-acid N-acetyltransferase